MKRSTNASDSNEGKKVKTIQSNTTNQIPGLFVLAKTARKHTTTSTTETNTQTSTQLYTPVRPLRTSTPINTPNIQIKTENDNTIQPPQELPKYIKNALGYKKDGLIRISIHRSKAFDTREMGIIMKHLGVTEVLSTDTNDKLIIALAKTGNLNTTDSEENILNKTVDMNEDTFPTFEQGTQVQQSLLITMDEKQTQVNQTDIENANKMIHTSYAKAFNIPPMIINNEPLSSTIPKPENIFFNHDAFKNYSNKTIPESVALILSFGPKFSVPIYYNKKDFHNLKEAAYNINDAFTHPTDICTLRQHIDKHITDYQNHQYEQHGSEVRDYFTNALKETQKFMKENEDLIVTQADKANATLIMDRNIYTQKVEELLSDTCTYTPLKQSCIKAYSKMNERLIDRMTEAKMISKKEAIEAIRTESKVANIYALIKTHKEGNPARPIVNTKGSPGYTLAKKATDILTKRARDTNKYNVLNSKKAIECIKSARILPDMKFKSYDAKSMFTNISVNQALKAVKKRQQKLRLTDIEMQMLIDIIKFVCTTNTEIEFNDRIYKQIKGLRMGSSLSPILADFVLEDMLDQIFTTIERPEIFLKYVDDIITVTTEEEHEKIFQALNKADNDLKFDMETENEFYAINYLDFTITNKPFELQTKWFQKHIASGRFLNFHTHHPKSVIWHTAVNFVATMLNNSDPCFLEEITNKARHLLKINSYPEPYAKQVITTAMEKIIIDTPTQMTQTTTQTVVTSTPIYVTGIPFIPGITQLIQTDIEKSSNQIREPTGNKEIDGKFPRNIKIASKPVHKMSQEIYNKHKRISSGKEIPSIDITQEEPTKNKRTKTITYTNFYQKV